MIDLLKWTGRDISFDLKDREKNFELDEMFFVSCADRTSPLWRKETYLDDEQWLMAMEFLLTSQYSPEWMKTGAADAIHHYKDRSLKSTIDMNEHPSQSELSYAENMHPGYVYLIGGNGYYKIGLSSNPFHRIEGISTKLPFEVELIHTIKTNDTRKLELELHKKYDHLRLNGEWFRLRDRDVEEIKKVGDETILETRTKTIRH